MKTPTPHDIKHAMETRPGGGSLFFSRNNMRFVGDTLRNFGTYRHSDGTIRLYRKRAVKHGILGEWIYDPQARSLRTAPRKA